MRLLLLQRLLLPLLRYPWIRIDSDDALLPRLAATLRSSTLSIGSHVNLRIDGPL